VEKREDRMKKAGKDLSAPNDIMRMIEELCGIAGSGINSGIHPGSTGDSAASYILDKLQKGGLEGAKLESIKVNSPFPDSYEVSVRREGKEEKDLSGSCFPIHWTVGTGPEGTEGEMIYLGDGSQSNFKLANPAGKIALIDEKFMRGYIASASDGTVMAKDKGAKAVLRLNQRVDSPQQQKGEGTPADIFPIPVFSVGKSAGDYLRGLAVSGTPHKIRLKLDVKHRTYDAFNVVAELPGDGGSEEGILVGTHYDGHFTGAVDNNGSVALMVKLAEYFSSRPRNRRMIFAWCFGHDCDLNSGHYQFGGAHASQLKKTIVWDVDHAIGGKRYRYNEKSGGIEPVEGETCEYYIISNSYIYSKLVGFAMDSHGFLGTIHRTVMAGIEPQGPQWGIAPAANPWCSCATIPLYYHSIHDTPEKITLDQVERAYSAHKEILEHLQALPEGLLFYDALNKTRMDVPPRVSIATVSEIVRVGDIVKVWNDETTYSAVKASHHYPAVPEWAGTIWDWGDGSQETVGGPTAAHSYDTPGIYTITMKFMDIHGAAAVATKTITVLEHKIFKPWDSALKIKT
jgi:hypothetical protein